ncbi:molybdopterin-synthase adenylyltransferase MoeB [Moritella viscosa]|uniref:Molybdopterin-synthase adenylyltransferase n=1 Tax=Moritella viscosa TaxID=80854 RepID=A0A1L0B318_9GAMM|nr:molybdopterin-synthase adenylyltransferase MoeB [Moritella viscosa]SGY90792.1 Molybdopterin biosynthesis protein MoeB [Moritella viscosa]SHO01331.1 Molybdopterin biosynthesis protein MoeB [Moritella viscosa]SHO01592.1 Molybdopterin biosynthesis protein MoeB [Moritella viscosa]SHO03260.1 Molybdopterin biosynthesis protein MoeB [Moritella viscosa]SHO05464.1 Molybdopterin biosynthesis protein MoeB [Moritella viscosa]
MTTPSPDGDLPSEDILSSEEELRYNRQIVLRNFDFDGQEALKQAKVLIIGAGGLGCASSQYLASAGMGQMTLVDFDHIELSNLQRQLLHRDSRIGEFKSLSAKYELEQINPHCKVQAITRRLSEDELTELIKQHDIVLDCTDNVDTREQINRACFALRTPLVSGAAIRMEGQISVFTYADDEPCYQCLSQLFGNGTLSCVESGIMAPMVGIIGAMQAMEAIKIIADFGQPMTGKVLIIDGLTLSFQQMKLPKLPTCTVCHTSRTA